LRLSLLRSSLEATNGIDRYATHLSLRPGKMQTNTLFKFTYFAPFELDLEELQANEPRTTVHDYPGGVEIYHQCCLWTETVKSVWVSESECTRQEADEFVELFERYPSVATHIPDELKNTLQIMLVRRYFDVPSLSRPELLGVGIHLTDRIKPNTMYCCDNVYFYVADTPSPDGLFLGMIQFKKTDHPEIDSEWQSILEKAEETLMAAVGADDNT